MLLYPRPAAATLGSSTAINSMDATVALTSSRSSSNSRHRPGGHSRVRHHCRHESLFYLPLHPAMVMVDGMQGLVVVPVAM